MPTPSRTRAQKRLSALLWFRPLASDWCEHVRAHRALASALARPAGALPGPPLTVVLPVYSRPENLCLSVALALRTEGVVEVRVCLNDPRLDPAELLDEDDPRVVIDRAIERRGPVERYRSAARSSGAQFLSPDDDIFLHPEQLRSLADHLRREPRCAHGIYGQLFDERRQRYTQNLCRREGSVHVLNRIYAFDRDHLDRYLARLDALGHEGDAARIAIDDDIVLSFTGAGLPQVHDLGAWVDCPSETDPRVSRFGRRDAAARRREQWRALDLAVGAPPPLTEMAEQPRWAWAPRTAAGAGLYYASGAPLVRAAARRLSTLFGSGAVTT